MTGIVRQQQIPPAGSARRPGTTASGAKPPVASVSE